MRKIWLMLGAVLLGGAVVWGVSFKGASNGGPAEFRLAPITRGNLRALVSASGTLNPLNTVKVGSQV
ncbi:MAG: efflux RND transporter periplasmic adaptor subunit, partial [Deltaproteobacteria bacterium]|nr:efflux RND transporter periplasmic adaptor subunit [Deltaproteobacteria bacterium]